MTVLVLGGNGFIGSHLVDRLLADGAKVRVFSRSSETFRSPLANVEYIDGDFSDSNAVKKALIGVDTVFHLISTSLPSSSMKDPVADIQGNLVNTVHLLELIRKSGVNRLVYLSSGGTVYGIPQQIPISETHPLHPISSYGVIKSTIEKYISMYHHLHGLNYVTLRVSNPYGPRQGHSGVQGVIGTFFQNIHDGNPIEIWGDGKIVRDFINIHDLTDLCVRVAGSGKTGIYNAGVGQGISILDLLSEISTVVERNINPIFKPSRAYDVPAVVLDISKAQSDFGWAPKVSLREGLTEYWDWIGRLS